MFVWISNENLRDVLGLSATLTTVLQFLTGVLICRQYFKSKSTAEVSSELFSEVAVTLLNYLQTSALPFTSGLLSCSLWLRYGILVKEDALIVVNSIGVFLFSLYCISYFLFCINKRRLSHQLCLVLLMITFSIGYSHFEPDDKEASKLIGKISKSLILILLIKKLHDHFKEYCAVQLEYFSSRVLL